MKICSKCNKKKSLENFGKNKNSTHVDGLQSYCKQCAREASINWYRNNKDKPDVAKRISEYNKSLLDSLKQEVDKIKAKKGCLICFENDSCALDFHHTCNKTNEVSYLRRIKNRKKMYEEIAKCVVLCSNCHRKLHAGKFELYTGTAAYGRTEIEID